MVSFIGGGNRRTRKKPTELRQVTDKLFHENNKLWICIIRDYAKQYTEKSFYIMLKNAVLKIISGSKSWNSPAFINQSLEMLIDIYKGHYKDSQARCTRYNIMWKSLSVTCRSSVGFFRVLRFPPPIKLTITILLKYC
jgi:hypothetical protein